MIPILMYHQIGRPAPRGSPYRALTVHPADFRRQMVWMRRLGYSGLAVRDLVPYLRGERQGKVFGITFDDGYRNVYQNAMPVLDELRFTATNYFVARQLGGSNVWDAQKGIAPSALMSADEMRAWNLAGHEVGCHTLDHVHLSELSPELAEYQIVQAKRELEEALGAPVTAFCYPYGNETPAIRAMVQRAGYCNATTTVRGLARRSDDLYGIPRVPISRSTHILRFMQKCLTRLEDRRRKD